MDAAFTSQHLHQVLFSLTYSQLVVFCCKIWLYQGR